MTVTDSPHDAVSFPSYFTMEPRVCPTPHAHTWNLTTQMSTLLGGFCSHDGWVAWKLDSRTGFGELNTFACALAMCGRSRLAESAIASTGAGRDWCASPRTATFPAAGFALGARTRRGALNASTKRLFTAHPSLLDGTFNRGNQHDGSRQQALAGSVAAFATGQLTTNSAPEKQRSRIAHKHPSLGIKPEQYQAVHDELMGAMRSRPRSLPRGKRCTG